MCVCAHVFVFKCGIVTAVQGTVCCVSLLPLCGGGTPQYETCVLICVSADSDIPQHVDFSEQVKEPSNADVKPDVPF